MIHKKKLLEILIEKLIGMSYEYRPPSTKDDVVCDPDVHLRVSGLVGEVEEAGRRGVDDVGHAQPAGVLPPEK